MFGLVLSQSVIDSTLKVHEESFIQQLRLNIKCEVKFQLEGVLRFQPVDRKCRTFSALRQFIKYNTNFPSTSRDARGGQRTQHGFVISYSSVLLPSVSEFLRL